MRDRARHASSLTATLALLRTLLLVLQTLHLGSTLGPSLSLPPRHPAVVAVVRLGRDAGLLGRATNLPIGLTVHVSRTQLGSGLGIRSPHTRDHGAVLSGSHQIRLRLDVDIWRASDRNPVQLPPGRGVSGRR